MDLITEKKLWENDYPKSEGGCDRIQITPDGKKLYVPSGWWSSDPYNKVVDAATGILAADAFHFGDEGIGIERGQRLEFVAGFLDSVFDVQPVEKGVPGLLLALGDFDEAADGGFGGFANLGRGFGDGEFLHLKANR